MKRHLLMLAVLGLAPAGLAQIRASLAQQKMCDEQAKSVWAESNHDSYTQDEYQSHFDVKSNACYVLINKMKTGNTADGGVWIIHSIYVEDAFSHATYAQFLEDAKNKIDPCYVEQGDKDTRTLCNSRSSFRSLVFSLFGMKAFD